ncbi:MAG TPA: hypothetical protein IAD06_09610 [Candidatus Caccoplasma intestinavium]|uniref:Uncharacterized protein n=1 Tax=Candidatus Caccoplasma intestinavium TaxID=2840716 RepID=A0A9D1KFA6_9BACT|nr:hypothetical protein [Candidatus Caccoplasma intestinavium]
MYVIQTTARRKNLLPSVTASQCNVILKGFALKNLPATACHAERSEASPPKRVKARDPSHRLWRIRDDIEIPRRPIGLARNDKRLPPSPLWSTMSERKNARLYRAAGSEGEDGNRARTV